MKLSDAPDKVLISSYIELRDVRAARKKEFEAEDAKLASRLEKLENELMRRFIDRGTDSTKADGVGTAFVETVATASVADKDAYFTWVLQDPVNRMCFVEARANKTAVRQFVEAHDSVPPGVDWKEARVVRVRRA